MKNFPPYSERYVLAKMITDYKKHGRIIVAYDFDDTIYTDNPQIQEFCNNVCSLLRECSKYPDDIYMICFTCRGSDDVSNVVIPFLRENNISCDKINEQADGLSRDMYDTLSCKVLYTIFLDDRCGLLFTYTVLTKFIMWLKVQRGEMLDIYGFHNFEALGNIGTEP